MGKFLLTSSDLVKTNSSFLVIKSAKYDAFNPAVLGLGEIKTKSELTSALCAFFDLQGFTDFCRQIDPELSVPEFLNAYLNWIFEEIKRGLLDLKLEEGYQLYAPLPLLSKFMGDGLLFIWDAKKMDEVAICNIIISLKEICDHYRSKFIPQLKDKIIAPPPKLRCGVARGTVYSVGNGEDYVGPCINMASRLQKISNLTFCFSRRGINFLEDMDEKVASAYIVKKMKIRGIGDEELVCILKEEYLRLPPEEKKLFRAP
jgi:hypothetical protein